MRCDLIPGPQGYRRRRQISSSAFTKRLQHATSYWRCSRLALFTPWSRRRAWVRHEIGMADFLKKRIVCIFYKVTVADFRDDEDGLGPLDGLNIVDINNLSTYFKALRRRAG